MLINDGLGRTGSVYFSISSFLRNIACLRLFAFCTFEFESLFTSTSSVFTSHISSNAAWHNVSYILLFFRPSTTFNKTSLHVVKPNLTPSMCCSCLAYSLLIRLSRSLRGHLVYINLHVFRLRVRVPFAVVCVLQGCRRVCVNVAFCLQLLWACGAARRRYRLF